MVPQEPIEVDQAHSRVTAQRRRDAREYKTDIQNTIMLSEWMFRRKDEPSLAAHSTSIKSIVRSEIVLLHVGRSVRVEDSKTPGFVDHHERESSTIRHPVRRSSINFVAIVLDVAAFADRVRKINVGTTVGHSRHVYRKRETSLQPR